MENILIIFLVNADDKIRKIYIMQLSLADLFIFKINLKPDDDEWCFVRQFLIGRSSVDVRNKIDYCSW